MQKPTTPPPDDLLQSKLKRPMDKSQMGQEKSAMRALVGMLNNSLLTGAEVPAGVDPLAEMNNEVVQAVKLDSDLQPPRAPTPPEFVPGSSQKLFFTGRMTAGKDHAAASVGATSLGVAEPLYYLANHFFGTKVSASEGKSIPGIRAFLQAAGQWGRAHVDEQYPLTPARACFVTMIRSLAAAGIISGHAVDWEQFGALPSLWLDAVLRRANALLESGEVNRVAVTNCRFKSEFDAFQAAGWTHYHVMCSPQTWAKRLAASKLSPESPQVKDVSEKLAAALDANVIKQISQQKGGHKLHCIWNDEAVPPPSNRLLTLTEFMREIELVAATPEVTGE